MGMFSCQRMRVLQWGQCERGCANVNCGVSMASSSRMSRASARHAAAIICGVRRITTFKKLPSNRPNTKQQLTSSHRCCAKSERSEIGRASCREREEMKGEAQARKREEN